MDRRGFLAALLGALGVPAGPALLSGEVAEPRLEPAVLADTTDLWERPYRYLLNPGKITVDRAFRPDTLCFQGDAADPLGEACAIELLVNGKSLCSGPIRSMYMGLNPLFPFVIAFPILIPKGTEIEFRCHGGEALIVHGSQYFTTAEMEAMQAEMDDEEEIDAEFVDEDDEEFN
jgi:hypothetical protein